MWFNMNFEYQNMNNYHDHAQYLLDIVWYSIALVMFKMPSWSTLDHIFLVCTAMHKPPRAVAWRGRFRSGIGCNSEYLGMGCTQFGFLWTKNAKAPCLSEFSSPQSWIKMIKCDRWRFRTETGMCRAWEWTILEPWPTLDVDMIPHSTWKCYVDLIRSVFLASESQVTIASEHGQLITHGQSFNRNYLKRPFSLGLCQPPPVKVQYHQI